MPTKNKKQNLLPELRFPEFREAGEWEEMQLGTQGIFLSSLCGKTAKDFDSGSASFIPYMNVFSNTFTKGNNLRSVVIGSDEKQNAVSKGDIFFTVSSETPEDAGMSSVLLKDIANCYLNSFCALFRFKVGRSPNFVFLGYFLRSSIPRAHLSRGAQGATRYNISKGVFSGLPLHLPSPAEQQKIADCLGSLDELLAAHRRKLAALQDHKKGLLQQLFPAEGETTPNLRFPGFEGEWEEEVLGELGRIVTGKTPSTKDAELWNGDILFITPTDISEESKYQHNTQRTVAETQNIKILPCGSIVYTCIASIGKMAITVAPSITNQQINSIVVHPNIRSEFLYYSLANLTPWIKSIPASSTLPIINKSEFSKILLTIPKDEAEQQIIADCLSALDALITAQTNQIAALHAHKKGLMQQLFPNPQGVA
jgi:type I restriction enzyme, S subunit